MGGGGKGGTTTQTVSIPPEVLARYNAVNARAEETAKQPFQPYGGEFVAPLTPTQTAGIQATNAAAGQAQPYYGAATRAAFAGAMPVNPGGLQVDQYMNPFTQSVVGATQAAMGQQFGQQQSQQQAEAIRSGAFGGDRAGLQRQALRGQQALAGAQVIAPLYKQGYEQALQTAQQQQGVGLGAAQANRQAVQQLSQQLGGLGTGAQQAALQGAQAQMAAGQVAQQTQQAQDTAQYQQFLQERGYPFQVAQFLANIAMGTGALSGSTTTTQQPGGFFSDKRLKEDVKEIGETHDGQPIYSYKYKGDDRTQIGLMAQDVEKRHPEAVGLMGGYKTVDYKKATEDAERTHKDMGGGLMPDGFDYNSMGGAVTSDMAGEGFERGGYVGGGLVGNDDWAQIVAANKQALGVYGGAQPISAGSPGAMGGLNIPTSMATPKLITAGSPPQQKPSGMSTAMQTGKDIAGIYKGGKEALLGSAADKSAGFIGGGGSISGKSVFGEFKDWWDKPSAAHGGLIVPRHAYADGGETDNEVAPYDPAETMRGEDPMKDVLASGSRKYEMLKPGQTPGGGGGSSPFGDIAKGIGMAKTAFDVGTTLAAMLPFSDARAKDNIRPVGKTFDGQNIYSYNIGEGPTQMGLMAQEVLERKPEAVGRRGEYLTVDYDRATEDATPYAYGGLVPRQGYATRGGTDIPADYSPEADMPSPNAQEAGLVVERPRYSDEDLDRAARDALALQMRRESGGDPQARAKTSSAAGLYQITDPTAKGLIQRNPGLGIQYDPSIKGFAATLPREQQEALGLALSKEHVRTLANQGFEPTPQNVSANWFLGGSGGPALLKAMQADPSMPATSVAGPDAIRANQTMFFKKDGSPRSVSEVYSMLNKTGGGAPVPPGLVGAGAQSAAPPTGAGEKKGFGDIITSEGFVVPALGFLGSMLASNRPNFGQALGEGIMGGVGAYQAQQKQLADIAKTKAETSQMLPVATARNIEAANKLATGLMQYNASLPPGSPKLTLQQYAKIVGYEGPLPSAAEQATGTETKESKPVGAAPGEVKVAEPSSRNWSFSPDEKETLVITYPDGTAVPASKDPLYLSKYADRYTTMGEGWAKEQAEAARKSADEIMRSGKTVDVKGNVVSLPGAIESGQKQKIGEGLAKEALEFNDAAQKYRPEAQNILSVLDDLGSNYSIYRAGSDSAARANFDRLMKVIDPDNKHPNLHPDQSWSAARYDKAVKDAFQLSIAQLSALSPRAPKAELDTLARTIPLPNLDAGAIQGLIGDAKARVLWNMKMHDAFDVNKDLNLNEFKKKFEKDNPFSEFKAEVKKTIPAAAGTQQQREQAAIPQSDLVVGKVYKDASGVQKKWTGSGWENP